MTDLIEVAPPGTATRATARDLPWNAAPCGKPPPLAHAPHWSARGWPAGSKPQPDG
jgi:hypothetical protein